MKKLISVLVLGLSLCFTSLAQAELKIAVVNVDAVFAGMPQAKTMNDTLKAEFEAKSKALDKEKSNVEKAAMRLQKEGLTMSASEKQKLVSTIENFQKKVQSLNGELEERAYQERFKLYEKIGSAINQIAEKEGYDIVLTNSAVGYVSSRVDDMTDVVLQTVSKDE